MVESNTEEKLQIDDLEIQRTSVMTGGLDRNRYLLYQLKMSMQSAVQIDIIVSFLMESGVKILLRDLEKALERGAKIRILTGNYLGITQPSALYLLKYRLGNRIDLRFYNDSGRSFHPKSYIFHYKQDAEIYIGSSNISYSALTSGIEWNYRFQKSENEESYREFYETFEELYENHSLVIDDSELARYAKNWHRPAVAKDLEKYGDEEQQDTKIRQFFEPRGAQIEALCALQNSRTEGATKGLVVAATGVGKTYLAAFDSKPYERVLFVAHREEILNQAAESFRNVRQSEDYGFFHGKIKDTEKSVIFASVATLGRPEYLNENYFPRDYFTYLVIDEFHHSVNKQYLRIVEYFQPKFMLGLTATPERLDGRNIYEICDYNIPYEIDLKDAINRGMLVPFRYYGIYDETDYSGLRLVKGHYDEKDLNQKYLHNQKRSDLIYKYYCKYGSRRALGFCCSREHAENMAREFSKRGIPSVAVYSNANGEYSENRAEAIQKLKDAEVRVIFSVDMFNEGIDITNVDMVMFLRPTESPTVFLQQLGRGLRKSKEKEYLNVLDFIGNYEKAGQVRYFLTGKGGSGVREPISEKNIPDGCYVDFDMRLIDLFEKMEHNQLRLKERIWNEFLRVEELLEKVPTRRELFTYMDDTVYELCIKNSKENIFKRYLEYLHEHQRLNPQAEELYAGIGREFISILENTNMSKVYKMPILRSFYRSGKVQMQVTEEDLLKYWKEFFAANENWKDLGVSSYQEYLKISDKAHMSNILKNPVNFLQKSGRGYFVKEEGCALALREELADVIGTETFMEQMKDVVEYRILDYYKRRYREKV